MFGNWSTVDWTWATAKKDLAEMAPFFLTAVIMNATIYSALFPTERGWRKDGSLLPSKGTFMASLSVPTDRPAEDEECPICQGDLEDAVQPECKHTYCRACLSSWFDSDRNWCPQCHRALFINPTDPHSIPAKINAASATLTVIFALLDMALDMFQGRRFWWVGLTAFVPALYHLMMVWVAVRAKGHRDWWQMLSVGSYLPDSSMVFPHMWILLNLLMELDKGWKGVPRARDQMLSNVLTELSKWKSIWWFR